MILSLAVLAGSQVKSDASSTVNNYYLVIETREPKASVSGYITEARTALGKKCLAPCLIRLAPTVASCSNVVWSCVTSIWFEWKKIQIILVSLNWASNQ